MRKSLMALVGIFCAGTMLHAAETAQVNLIVGGDFNAKAVRNGLGKWWNKNNVAIQQDTKVFVSPSRSIKFADNDISFYQVIPGLKSERKYKLSFYLKMDKVVPAPGKKALYIRFDEGKHVSYFPSATTSWQGTQDWKKIEITFMTRKDVGSKTAPYICFAFLGGSKGTAWIDDVTLIEVQDK